MTEIRYETPAKELINILTASNYPNIFLAGPTVRGHQIHLQPSWRFEACSVLRQFGFQGNVVIPEFTDVSRPDLGNENWIVPWENIGLTLAHAILFWIPRTKELIGLNTNFELGLWLGRYASKIVYGRPDNSYRNKYLDIMMTIIHSKPLINYVDSSVLSPDISTDLKSTCIRAIKLASDRYASRG